MARRIASPVNFVSGQFRRFSEHSSLSLTLEVSHTLHAAIIFPFQLIEDYTSPVPGGELSDAQVSYHSWLCATNIDAISNDEVIAKFGTIRALNKMDTLQTDNWIFRKPSLLKFIKFSLDVYLSKLQNHHTIEIVRIGLLLGCTYFELCCWREKSIYWRKAWLSQMASQF